MLLTVIPPAAPNDDGLDLDGMFGSMLIVLQVTLLALALLIMFSLLVLLDSSESAQKLWIHVDSDAAGGTGTLINVYTFGSMGQQ